MTRKTADIVYFFPVPRILYQEAGYQGYTPEKIMAIQFINKRKVLSQQEKNQQVSI